MFSLHGASLTIRGAIGFPKAWSHLRLMPSTESVSSPKRVNFPRCAKHAGDHRYLEAFDVFEHERRSFVRRDFFKKLPAYRGDFPILVDFFGDALEFALLLKCRDIFAKISVSHESSPPADADL